MVKLNLLFALLISCALCNSCKTNSCIYDNRILVKDTVCIGLEFLGEKNLSKYQFNNFFTNHSFSELDLKNNEIDIDFFKEISEISAYDKEEGVEWEDFKKYALKDCKLYYLGKHVLNKVDLHFIFLVDPNKRTNTSDRMLYLITEGSAEKWITSIAVNLSEGFEPQVISSTKRKGNVFTYTDYSDSAKLCSKYKIDNTGAIVLLD